MDTVFDKLTNTNDIDEKKQKYLDYLKLDLFNYKNDEHVRAVYTDKELPEDEQKDTYWVLKTYYILKDQNDQDTIKYEDLIIDWLKDSYEVYKEKNEELYKTKATEKYKYDKSIIMSPDKFPGNYTDNETIYDVINKFNFNESDVQNPTNENDAIYNNMKILYDLSAELYNNDTALKLCSIMIKPYIFNELLNDVSERNNTYKKEILEYFFHLVPYLPRATEYEKITKNNLSKLFIFTSGSVLLNPKSNILNYDDCLLDTVLFKNLYTAINSVNKSEVKNNSSLFVFSFRLITKLNDIINDNHSEFLTTDKYYFTLLANTITELHYKNIQFKKFLDEPNNKVVIDEYYETAMKDITPVNVYIKVNNMSGNNYLNPRYNFIYTKSQSFFNDLKLEYFNSDKKVGFNDVNIDELYNHQLASKQLNSNSKKEYYNLGKINGYYDTSDQNEIINDPNCGGLLINRINNGENVIIIGNGQSGSGKTASLIYLQKDTKDIEGILPKILNKLNKTYNRINIRLADIYLNWDSKLNNVEKITNKHYMVKPIKKQNGDDKFVFTRNRDNKWMIETNYNTYLLGKFINELFKSREIQPTKNNPDSSRSHVLVLVEIYKNETLHSKLVICDLAGVEDEFTCNCEQLVNLLNIYRTKSEKYKDDNLEDTKLYFDNYTCDSDDYQTTYQKYFFKDQPQNNLTEERSKTIVDLYNFVNQVDNQLKKIKKDENGVVMYPDINNLNLGTHNNNNETYLDDNKKKENIYCIKPEQETIMKEKLQKIMKETSGHRITDISNFYDNYNLLEMTTFYKFYNVSESDNIDKILEQMFALYNIYMKLYNYIRYIADEETLKLADETTPKLADETTLKFKNIDSYTEESTFKKYEKQIFNLRFKAVSKLNESTNLMNKFTNNNDKSLSDIFIRIFNNSYLKGLLIDKSKPSFRENFKNNNKIEFNNKDNIFIDTVNNENVTDNSLRRYRNRDRDGNISNRYTDVVIANLSYGLYNTKENNEYTTQLPYQKKSFNSIKITEFKEKQFEPDLNEFKSDSRNILFNIFLDYINNNKDEAYKMTRIKYYLYSGFICEAFLSSIKRIINQIVGDIIRMKIMNFNCKLRKKEGYFINRSLAEMQRSLSSVILRELNRKTVSEIKALETLPNSNKIKDKLIILNYLSPISNDCYKDNYMYNDFNFNNLMFDKNATIPGPVNVDTSEIILRIIFDSGEITGQNYNGFGLDPRIINSEGIISNDDQYKTTSIMVFTVINLTDDGIVNNPPNPPYINTNNLKRIYNISNYFKKITNYKILKENTLILTEDETLRLKKLEEKFIKYKKTFKNRILKYDFYKNNQTIKNEMDNPAFGQIYDSFTNKISDQNVTLKVIDLIDSNNKTTLIGTISFDVFTQPFTQLKNNKDYRFYICDAINDQYINKSNYTNNIPDTIVDNDDDDLIKEPVQADAEREREQAQAQAQAHAQAQAQAQAQDQEQARKLAEKQLIAKKRAEEQERQARQARQARQTRLRAKIPQKQGL